MNKLKCLNKLLEKISSKKKRYHNKMIMYRKIDEYSEIVIIFLGSGSTALSLLMLSFTNPMFLVGSVICSTSAFLLGSLKKGMNIRNKYESFKTTYDELHRLEREYTIQMSKDINESSLSDILEHLNSQLSIIEGSAITI